jgi:hypothetical protein
VVGIEGRESDEAGNIGVMGLCHDCTVWKESWLEEKSDKVDSSDFLPTGEPSDRPLVFLEGGEVSSVSCGGAVTDRPVSRTSGRPKTSCLRACGIGARGK